MGSTGRGGEAAAAGEVTRADFPDGFVFGVATSAYQVSCLLVVVLCYYCRLPTPAPTLAKLLRDCRP
jgi:hypothetical protein